MEIIIHVKAHNGTSLKVGLIPKCPLLGQHTVDTIDNLAID